MTVGEFPSLADDEGHTPRGGLGVESPWQEFRDRSAT